MGGLCVVLTVLKYIFGALATAGGLLLMYGLGARRKSDVLLGRRNALLVSGLLLVGGGLLTYGATKLPCTTAGPTDQRPPVADVMASPESGSVPLEIEFNACASRSFNGNPTYTFTPGDNTEKPRPTNKCHFKHTYNSEGTFTASVTVTDAANRTGFARTTITLPSRTIRFSNLPWHVRTSTQPLSGEYWSNSADSVWTADGELHLAVRKVGTHIYQADVYTTECFAPGAFGIYLDSRPGELKRAGVTAAYLAEAGPSRSLGIRFGAGMTPSTSNLQYFVAYPSVLPYAFEAALGSGDYTTHFFHIWADHTNFQSWYGHAVSPTPQSPLFGEWSTTTPTVKANSPGYRVHISLGESKTAPARPIGGQVVVTRVILPATSSCK